MTIEELCAALQKKRTELGLNIEEVVEKTKLYPSVIRDIEAGNLGNISSAYLKGYIRIYASFLGVDLADALTNLNLSNAPKNKPLINKQETLREKPKQERKPIPPYIKKVILYVIVALIVLPLLIAFVRFVSKSISRISHKPVKKIEKRIAKPIILKNKSKEVTVSLSIKRDCFVRVKVDGKVLFEGILKKGVSETWKGKKEIEFKLSDGSAVYLEINGKALPALTSAHKSIKSLKITPSGVAVSK